VTRDLPKYFARRLTTKTVRDAFRTDRAGLVKVCFCFSTGTVWDEDPARPVQVRLCGVGRTSVNVPLPNATTPETAPGPKQQTAKAAAAAAAVPAAPVAPPAVVARLELQGDRVRLQLRVGGREALNFGAAPRNAVPRRSSALAAGPSRARSEQELEQALAAAEAGEVERAHSQELERQLAVERAEKEALARRAAAAEEAAREAAEAGAEAERAAAERLAKQRARSQAALEKARDDAAEWRDRAGTFEEQLYDERRQPDARVRSENAATLAARAEAEREAKRLQGENKHPADRSPTAPSTAPPPPCRALSIFPSSHPFPSSPRLSSPLLHTSPLHPLLVPAGEQSGDGGEGAEAGEGSRWRGGSGAAVATAGAACAEARRVAGGSGREGGRGAERRKGGGGGERERGRGEGSRGGAAAATAARQRRERAAGPWSCARGEHMPNFAHVRVCAPRHVQRWVEGRVTLLLVRYHFMLWMHLI